MELQELIWSSVITHHVTVEVNFGNTCFVLLLATFKRGKSAQVKFPQCRISASLLEALMLFFITFFLTQCANATLLCLCFIGPLAFPRSHVISSCPVSVAPSADTFWPLLPPAPLRQAPALDHCRCHSASVCCPPLPKSRVEHLCAAAAMPLVLPTHC